MDAIKITKKNRNYPKRLLKIKDAPEVLYVVGDIKLLNKEKILGVVGSRKCSEYGRKVASLFANELSKSGITIISGLAIGIDSASHIGSMEEKRKNNCSFRQWV